LSDAPKSAAHEALMTKIGADRFRRKSQAMIRDGYTSLTDPGAFLMKRAVADMAAALDEFREEATFEGPGRRRAELKLFEDIPSPVIALLVVRALVDVLAVEVTMQSVATMIGKRLEDERQMRWIEANEPSLWSRIKDVFTGNNKTRKRKKLVKAVIRDHEFTVPKSAPMDVRRAGVTLVELFIQTTGLMYLDVTTNHARSQKGRVRNVTYVRGTPETLDWLMHSVEAQELVNPYYLPCLREPLDWAGFRGGGYPDGMVHRKSFVKVHSSAHADVLVDEDMPQVYDAVNRIQRTPWRLNQDVLMTLKTVWGQDREIAGLPGLEKHPIPARVDRDEEPEAHALFVAAVRAESERRSKYMRVIRTLFVANTLGENRFWFPQQLDFRGRCYSIPFTLNPQSDDMSKGLLEFADPCDLRDPEAVRWLAIHGANCWGHDKLPLDERVAWVEEHSDRLRAVYADPVEETWWAEADKPWQFLAFALAWGAYLEEGPDVECRLPVAMDGTNNGLQLYSLALRDPIGATATNCTASSVPRDIYQDVADRTTELIREDDSEEAAFWLDLVDGQVPRTATKRSVMTLPYGATFYACQRYVVAWMRQLAADRGLNLGTSRYIFTLGTYLAERIWMAIGEIVVKAREAMDWLHTVAELTATFEEPLFWTSPIGFPVLQDYRMSRTHFIRTRVGDTTRHVRFATSTGEDLNKPKQRQGVAPNYIHSIDAAILMDSVNRAYAQGVRHYSMVHDSYGVLPADAPVMARCLRESSVAIFSTPVLDTFRDQIQRQLPEGVTLPPVPEGGDFDITEVLRSPYYFS